MSSKNKPPALRLAIPLGFGLAVLTALGVAGAQGLDASAAAPGVAGGDQGAPAPIEVEESLSPQQRQQKARQFISRMEQASVQVRRQLEQARAARDVVKVLCLNDKLTQIDVARRSAADRMVALDGAAQAADADRAKHEYAVLAVLRERVEALVAEANQCIGEEAQIVGESDVTVTIDPNIPEQDPDQLGVDPELISPPPVLSSPTE